MHTELPTEVRDVARGAEAIGLILLIGLAVIVTFPSTRTFFAADSVALFAFIMKMLIIGGVLFWAGWALRGRSILSFYMTWLIVLAMIVQLSWFGILLGVCLAVLLIRSRKFFTKAG